MCQDRFDHTSQGGACAADVAAEPDNPPRQALDLLKRQYRAEQGLRRGICLLNAGQYEQAAEEFSAAHQANPGSLSLPRMLAACYVGEGRFDLAARETEQLTREDPDDVTARIRRALLLWRDGHPLEAIECLRQDLGDHPESAELQFQLGTLLAARDEYEEAELRFTQAITIDQGHTEALIALAQCCAVGQRVMEAKRHLERAQRRRPHDARVGLLLAQAAGSLADQGITLGVQAQMPEADGSEDDEAIEQLSRIVESEPGFVDAFLALPLEEVEASVYALLAEILNRALARRPQEPALHCARGQVLELLGRPAEAIAATERAVDLDPRFVQALIQLARLYQQTDRHQDAMTRLEEVLRLGAEFADVYYLLGNLYRGDGQTEQARRAYLSALRINDRYEAARAALQTLAA